MKVCRWNEIQSLAVKQMGKPAVYIDNGLEYNKPQDDEIWKFIISEVKAIYDETDKFYDIMSGLVGGSMFFFDTEEDQYRFYRIFEQPLTDSSDVYACIYGSDGQCQTENT